MTENGIYRHYKGRYYCVLGRTTHSETEEAMVLYQPLYGERQLWVRPENMFAETVLVDGVEAPRFERTGAYVVTTGFKFVVNEADIGRFSRAFKVIIQSLESSDAYVSHDFEQGTEQGSLIQYSKQQERASVCFDLRLRWVSDQNGPRNLAKFNQGLDQINDLLAKVCIEPIERISFKPKKDLSIPER